MFKLKQGWKDVETNRNIAWLETVAVRLGLLVVMKNQCLIVQERVTSDENNADDLSRGDSSEYLWHNEAVITLPPDLRTVLEQECGTPNQANKTKAKQKGASLIGFQTSSKTNGEK